MVSSSCPSRNGRRALIALAKSLLEGEHIESLLKGEGLQDLFGPGDRIERPRDSCRHRRRRW
jgi:hypothetical protein